MVNRSSWMSPLRWVRQMLLVSGISCRFSPVAGTD